GFAGKEWSDHAFVGFNNAKRNGLGVFFDQKPLDDSILKMIPKDTVAFQTMRLDLVRIFDEVRTGVKIVEPNAVKDFDDAIASASKMIRLDIRNDILAPLGDTVVLYRVPHVDGSQSGFAALIQVRDEKTLAATLTKVE